MYNRENVKGIIIGINNYNHVNKLKYAVEDATEFYNIMIGEEGAGYDPNNFYLLTDESDDEFKPIKNNILNTIDMIKANITSEDALIFYYAGHGRIIDKTPILVPKDYRSGYVSDGIQLDLIKDMFTFKKIKYMLFILDSCHSAAMITRDNGEPMSKEMIDYLDKLPEGFSVITSCRDSQKSYPDNENKHGIFTYYILNELIENYKSNKSLSISNLYENVYPKVQKRALELHNKIQIPWSKTQISGTFYFSKQKENIHSINDAGDYEINEISLISDYITYDPNEAQYMGIPEDNLKKIENIRRHIVLGLRKVYGLKQIKQEGHTIIFPNGFIERNVYLENPIDPYEKQQFTILFNNLMENVDKVNHLLAFLAESTFFLKMAYKVIPKIDFYKLDEYCEKNDIEVLDINMFNNSYIEFYGQIKDGDYNKIKYREYPEHGLLSFNYSSKDENTLMSNFYEDINIENVLSFIKMIT